MKKKKGKPRREQVKNLRTTDKIEIEEKEISKILFKNEQMLLHLVDISDEIDLKISEGKIIIYEDLVVTYKNRIIPIEISIIKLAYIYKKLEKTFRLEAKILIEEIFNRGQLNYITELDIINILKEIRKQQKLQAEKTAFKNKIVWLRKED